MLPTTSNHALGLDLLPAQADFVATDDRFIAFIGGVGSGKTYAGAIKAVRYALDHAGSLGVIGAPNKTVLRDSTIRTLKAILPPHLIKQEWKSEGRLELVNGSEILYRSMDDFENRRGSSLAWFWLDEGIYCGYDAWRVMKARLRQPGMPHQGWLTSTPRGMDLFYRDFEQHPAPRHILIRAATRDNHYLPADYAESLGFTGSYALQELEGQFVAREGLVYHVGPASVGPAPPLAECTEIWGGIDWGYRNPLHLSIFGERQGVIHQIAEFRAVEANFEASALPLIIATTGQYNVKVWYCGTDRPEHRDALNVALQQNHLPSHAVLAETPVLAGIDTVRAYLEADPARLIIDPGCVHTIAEIAEYHYPDARAPEGDQPTDRDENPVKERDHALDALRYAIHSHLGHTRQRRLAHRYLAHVQARQSHSITNTTPNPATHPNAP